MSLSPKVIEFEKTWSELLLKVDCVINLRAVNKVSWMGMYEDVYALCTSIPPHSDKVYDRLNQYLIDFVSHKRDEVLENSSEILKGYNESWKSFLNGTEFLHAAFRYLNETWIKNRSKDLRGSRYMGIDNVRLPMPVAELASFHWRTLFFEKVKPRLIHEVLKSIEADRNGQTVDSATVQGVIYSFVQLNRHSKTPLQVYIDEFEVPFLASTAEYYKRESCAFLVDKNCSSYMCKAEIRLEEEVARCRKFLDSSSYEKVSRECENQLVSEHKAMMHSECEGMVRDGKLEDLTRMYNLLRRVPNGIDPMLAVFQNYVSETGSGQIRLLDEEGGLEPKKYVETLLEVHRKNSVLVEKAFGSDASFVAALDKACRTVVNYKPKNPKAPRAPELLARYCDLLLKKSAKNEGELEIEENLSQVIQVFKYIDDKDIFQTFYSKMCAKRLIYGNSLSSEAEGSMISRLKTACGYEYTSKLTRMFTDMNVSDTLNSDFRDLAGRQNFSLGTDFHILVLQSGAWPVTQPSSADFHFPQELEKCVEKFESYYSNKYNGRKLSWFHHLSRVDVSANYLKRYYEIQTTIYQMAILLMFNSLDSIPYADISLYTKLNDSLLRRTLQSLLDVKLLKKNPSETPLEESDIIQLNFSFSAKRTKFKLASTVQTETPVETEKTHRSIDSDRKLYLQAAIVRIMKSRKCLTHLELVNEVISQCSSRFAPSIPMVKKCIEGLIDRQFLERSETSKDSYSYIA